MVVRFSTILLTSALLLAAISCEESGKAKKAMVNPAPRAVAPSLSAKSDPPPPPQVPEKRAPQVDPVEDLIARVEKEFRAGQANYSAGHPDAAKDNFDRAFNLLLQSPLSVRNDDRLQGEFDKLVESVHDLEVAALKQGDGFTAQASEPAPIDEANAVTFPVDPNVKAKAEAELSQTKSDLPLMLNDQVAMYINYFSSRGRGYLERGLVRSGRYEGMIRSILQQEGVPQDLIYLAEAESGFHPLALSRAGARGMWQFMSSRGVGYGLERNWWVDDRQDPEKSTRAAARHLKDLYNEFGDWYLAMAAYNSGPGNVQQAVQRTGYADFWELYRRNVLPAETKNYVPIILAVTIMAKNPSQYSLDHLVKDPPDNVDRVVVDYPVDLRLVAECVDSDAVTIQDLNPSLLRMTTPKDSRYELRLPQGTAEQFQKQIAAIPRDMRVWWRYHRVKSGESLSEIARQYKTTPAAIEQVNNLKNEELRTDAKIIIPVAPRRGSESANLIYSKHPTIYRVRKGDTAASVADDFGVAVERLRRWNHLKSNHLQAGKTLRIYRPVGTREVAEARPKPNTNSKSSSKLQSASEHDAVVVRHRVKAGETLASIASKYEVTVSDLRRSNAHLSNNIHPGDVLVVKIER
ncbi:MAG TPA: LysM peptidoglycan-binding domain-containing protein [Terriglobales bacterium]|nr:LysM peptidoglycan-binding domain-containing protein [Terriglobales bacterium]